MPAAAAAAASPAASGDVKKASNDDPLKHRFGSKPSADGLVMEAKVKRVPGSDTLFRIHAWVGDASGAPLSRDVKVRFYFHPTFRRSERDATVGQDGTVSLDLVTDVPGAPAEFAQGSVRFSVPRLA